MRAISIALLSIACYGQNATATGEHGTYQWVILDRNLIAGIDSDGHPFIVKDGKRNKVSKKALVKFIRATDKITVADKALVLTALGYPALNVYGLGK